MPQVSVAIDVRVPHAALHAFVKALAEDSHLTQAYFKLRGMPSPSRLVECTAERLAIFEPSFDPGTQSHGALKTGWTIVYELEPIDDAATRVGVSVEYDRKTAVMGLGLIKAQADNEVIARLGALLAFERGYHTLPSGTRTDVPPALPEGTPVDPLPDAAPDARVPQPEPSRLT